MVTKKARATGSQKLAASRGSKKSAGTSGLEKAVATLDKSKINHDILIRGIPFPDVIRGTFTVKPSQLNAALGTIMGIKGIEFKPVKLFPIGVPVINEVRVQLDGKVRK